MNEHELIERIALDPKIMGLITNDKDFGEKVFRGQHPHHGILFLRLADNRANNKIEVLSKLLDTYSARIADQFVVFTESRVRFAKL